MRLFLAVASMSGMLLGQTQSTVNPADAKWEHGPRNPDGAESVTVREDAKTGGLELLVHYAGGHVFKPHWHESNERIVLLEGRLSLRKGDTETFLEPGGYAFLPARELQTMVCVSKARCSFYVAWDGNPKSHPPVAKSPVAK